MLVQAAGVWLFGRIQMCSQRLLASWHLRVRMPVAPGSVQRMPDNLSRWPITALQPASTVPDPTNRPRDRYQA